MAKNYDIICGEESVGTARVEKEGLYSCFLCRCRQPDEGLYRVHVICGDRREDLGICIPMDGMFGMDKRIPSKRLGDGAWAFELVPKDWMPPVETPPESEELFAPVSEEEPFEYLDKLEGAVLGNRDAETGILLPEEQVQQPGEDSPEI